MIAALRPLLRETQILYFAWALSEIDPMHPDVGYIVQRLHSLRAERDHNRVTRALTAARGRA